MGQLRISPVPLGVRLEPSQSLASQQTVTVQVKSRGRETVPGSHRD